MEEESWVALLSASVIIQSFVPSLRPGATPDMEKHVIARELVLGYMEKGVFQPLSQNPKTVPTVA